ncbi:MAG: T9SS C-terminal target domain-containing protein [Saprospirales bacterium]|nr:MAG: T9SS C-terminal target domain-containing protein [Saprospirales bacterium]
MTKLLISLFVFTFLLVNALQAQTYRTPCEAADNPIDFGTEESSVNLNGSIYEVIPFITDTLGVNIQNFGITDADSAIFYLLNPDPETSFLRISWEAGTVPDLWVGLIGFENPCPDTISTDFGEFVHLSTANEELLSNDIQGDEVIFDLCNLDVDSPGNLFLWVASSDSGTFEILVTQHIRPVNDHCQDPFDFGVIESNVDEVICLEEINAPRTNLWGCAENYNPSFVENVFQYDIACFEGPLEPNMSGVWYRFETDEEARRLDMDFYHYSESDEIRFVLFTPDPNVGEECEAWVILMCEESVNGEIFLGNRLLEPNTVYYMLFYSEREIADDFDLCINVKPPGECLGIAPYYYNHTEIICGLSQLNGFCLYMGPPYPPSFINWPGCNPPFGVAFHNPQWFTFVSGEANQLSIDVEISECIGQGVQIAMYELDCNVEFDPSEQSPGIQPTANMLVSDCILTAAPQIGVVNFKVNNVVPGTVYGIVVDGWANAVCKVEVLEVLVGGDPPHIDDDLVGEPEFDNKGFGFQPGDTICEGATDVLFALVQEVAGACTYRWTVNGDSLTGIENPLTISVDFPDPGVYEICVAASNICQTTAPICIEVVVAPLEFSVQFDTTCRGHEYLWEETYFGIIELLEPIEAPGDYEISTTATSDQGCTLEADLFLHVLPDNFDKPTEFFEVICWDDPNPVYVPFEGHPQAQSFDMTGIYGLDGELFITQESFPGNVFECDSFFLLELLVLEADIGSLDFECSGSELLLYHTESLSLPGLQAYVDQMVVRYEWRRAADGSILSSGFYSDSTDLLLNLSVEELTEAVEIFSLHLFSRYSEDPDSLECENIFSIEIIPSDLDAIEVEINGPDTLMPGEQYIFFIEEIAGMATFVSWSFDPEPEEVVIDFSTRAANVVFTEPGEAQICIVASNFCGLMDSTCIVVMVDTDVATPFFPAEEFNFQVYPNPFAQLTQVHSDLKIGSASWELYNVEGRQLLKGEGEYEKKIPVNTGTLPPGIYFLKLLLEEGAVMFKVVKQ